MRTFLFQSLVRIYFLSLSLSPSLFFILSNLLNSLMMNFSLLFCMYISLLCILLSQFLSFFQMFFFFLLHFSHCSHSTSPTKKILLNCLFSTIAYTGLGGMEQMGTYFDASSIEQYLWGAQQLRLHPILLEQQSRPRYRPWTSNSRKVDFMYFTWDNSLLKRWGRMNFN